MPGTLLPSPVNLRLDVQNAEFLCCCHPWQAPGAECSGLPPASCLAFGRHWRPSFDHANGCVNCQNAQLAFYCAIIGGGVVLAAAAAYIIVLVKFPKAFERWGGTITLVLTHTQTLSILGQLSVEWPATTQVAFSGFDLVVGDMAALRAECLVGERSDLSEKVSMYHLKVCSLA